MISETTKWINLLAFCGVAAAPFSLLFSRKIPWWGRFLLGFAVSFSMFIVVLVTASYFDAVEARWGSVIKSTLARASFGVGAIVVGGFAHYCRNRNRFRYGQIEVFFGALSAAVVAGTMKTGSQVLLYIVALVGAAFVVARGLDNCSKHFEEKGNESGHRALTQYVRSLVLYEDVRTGTNRQPN